MIDTYTFALVLDCIERKEHEIEDALFEAGCDDGLVAFRGQTTVVEFDREASGLEAAVLSAMENVANSGLNASILRIEPNDLVSAAEIARRADVTRQAVKLWTAGERRSGFPPPRTRVGKSQVWSWREVVAWLHTFGDADERAVQNADTLAGLNLALEIHRGRAEPIVWASTQALGAFFLHTGSEV